jgi:hypothetical protein
MDDFARKSASISTNERGWKRTDLTFDLRERDTRIKKEALPDNLVYTSTIFIESLYLIQRRTIPTVFWSIYKCTEKTIKKEFYQKKSVVCFGD